MGSKPHELAWQAFTTALGLYGRNFGTLIALSVLPAAARVGYFLNVPWMSGDLSVFIELAVAACRIMLILATLRIVFPQDLTDLQNALSRGALRSRIAWQELAWQLLAFVTVIALLNGGAGWLVATTVGDPRFETANLFALKNLFVTPFATLYLFVAARATLKL